MRSYEDADNFPCPYCGIAANPGGLTCETCPRCGADGCGDCITAGVCCPGLLLFPCPYCGNDSDARLICQRCAETGCSGCITAGVCCNRSTDDEEEDGDK